MRLSSKVRKIFTPIEFSQKMEELNDLMANLGITKDTTRHGAKVLKKSHPYNLCVVCFRQHYTKNDLIKHFKEKHRASKEEIKNEYQEAKAELSLNRDGAIEQANYKLALLRVSALVKYKYSSKKPSE
jgi:hypothetical protein